ncbi:cytochrome P450 [Tuber borchii]|uniref:Cytochrome P450 n=1 Tax=Tuber borchii TaxID=42251 RepID=A0A2T7A7T6_TUBBO|nr:cytochrome P450 [Tuber borchii]
MNTKPQILATEIFAEQHSELSLMLGLIRLWSGSLTTAIGNGKDGEGSYQMCLHVLCENFIWTVIAPSWLLEMLPFKALREAGGAASNFRFFMNEWFEERKAKIELDNKTALKPPSTADLMESLVRSSGLDKGSTLETPLLWKSEVIGNAFIFILAGHDTTGHTIANAIYFLAMHPEYQVKLQEEIDSILGDGDHHQTSYETHFDTFSSGWRETIVRNSPPHSCSDHSKPPNRFHPPHLPSHRQSGTHHTPSRYQILDPNNRPSHNPKYWTQLEKTEAESGISKFRPERWLPKLGDNAMFKPYNESYIPFSIGARGVYWEEDAYIEFTAIILGLFREMSVEFDSYRGRKAFDEAKLECLAQMSKFKMKLSLQPTGEMPGIKWVRRR